MVSVRFWFTYLPETYFWPKTPLFEDITISTKYLPHLIKYSVTRVQQEVIRSRSRDPSLNSTHERFRQNCDISSYKGGTASYALDLRKPLFAQNSLIWKDIVISTKSLHHPLINAIYYHELSLTRVKGHMIQVILTLDIVIWHISIQKSLEKASNKSYTAK